MYPESKLTEIQTACLDVIKADRDGCTSNEVYNRLGRVYTVDEVNAAMRKLRSMELIRKNRTFVDHSRPNQSYWMYWRYCQRRNVREVSE